MELYIPRFFQIPDQSYFLFGPRGTGKSTFLKHHFPNALWIDLLKPDVYRTYLSHPEHIIEFVHGNPDKDTIVLDEVQRVPEILSSIHSLIEEKTGKKFILTGSSARKLKRSGIDLLAGRVLLKTMHPFLLSELTIDLSFDSTLQDGLLPVVVSSPDPQETLNSYVTLYIREEVQYESLVRNIGNFSRFLETISFSHASILNISNVAREAEIERKVVESYIRILEDILLGFRIPVFSKKAKRAVVSRPKFYLFDAGVYTTLRPKGPLDSPEEIGGAALEGMVAQHLRAWNAYRGKPFDLFYWRSRAGVEVDFVLYGEPGIYGIEVKNSQKVRSADLRSLMAFRSDYPQSHCILLYRGKERLVKNEILCLPCETFLKNLHPTHDLNSI
jgi:predicted AAA+ superfamily ATPase